jgi:hypothetical protein
MGDNGIGNNTTNNTLLTSNVYNEIGSGPVVLNPTGVRLGTAGIGFTSIHFPEYIELIELRFSGPARE